MGECPLIVCFICEFIGTSILMYVGCMGCVDLYTYGPTIPAYTFGCAILAAIQTFSHFTHVHLNPAATVSSLILGRMGLVKGLVYILAQYTGAIAGYVLMKVTLVDHNKLCLLQLHHGIKPAQGFFLETFTTMLLMLVVAGSTDGENHHSLDSIPVRIALLIVGLVYALEPHTGCCLNPARSLPPCIVYNYWKNHWLYHLGPYIGGALAGLLYKLVFDNNTSYSLYSLIKQS